MSTRTMPVTVDHVVASWAKRTRQNDLDGGSTNCNYLNSESAQLVRQTNSYVPSVQDQHMTMRREMHSQRYLIGRLPHGSDLLEEITRICREESVRLGRVDAIGAVRKARIAYYDQDARDYRYIEMDRELELTKLVGNVTLKEDQPMVHAHLTLADKEGKAFGGHLAPGTVVFACEFIIQVFDGPSLTRSYDQETGLQLWSMD